jgi:hypothetical protein
MYRVRLTDAQKQELQRRSGDGQGPRSTAPYLGIGTLVMLPLVVQGARASSRTTRAPTGPKATRAFCS